MSSFLNWPCSNVSHLAGTVCVAINVKYVDACVVGVAFGNIVRRIFPRKCFSALPYNMQSFSVRKSNASRQGNVSTVDIRKTARNSSSHFSS